jgi:CRP-like cAMP-binding protein
MERVLFLQRVPLFSSLPPADLKQVAQIGREKFFPHGEAIVQIGEVGDEVFIIVSGEVRVLVENDREIARRHAGEYVGEMSILSQEPRSATVVADGDVRTLCITQAQFEGILRERPETALAVMRVLCKRLQEQSKKNGKGYE